MAGKGRRTLSVVRGLAEGLAGNLAANLGGGLAEAPARLLRAPAPPAPEPHAILAALATAVVVVDGQGRFRFANQAAEEFFALSSTSLRATRLADLVPEDSPLFALITQVLAGAISVSDYDLSIESPRLSKRGITVHGAPVPGEVNTELVELLEQHLELARTGQVTSICLAVVYAGHNRIRTPWRVLPVDEIEMLAATTLLQAHWTAAMMQDAD